MEIQFAEKLPQDRQSIVDDVVDMITKIAGKFETVEEATWQYKVRFICHDEKWTV